MATVEVDFQQAPAHRRFPKAMSAASCIANQNERKCTMNLKQENALEDSTGAIEDITKLFQTMNMPKLAEANLYLGTPHPILENLRQALGEQRAEDEQKRFVNRMRYAGIVRERSSDTFKWDKDIYPLAEPGAIECALNIEFVSQLKNLVVAGPPGVGKTLLVIIIACKALKAGFSVKYKTAHDIAVELREARDGNSLSGYVKKLQACDLLVIEDATFATFDNKAAQSFFSVIDGRYGRKSTAITSNGNINEWASKFPDKNMSSALLGRFYEDAVLINMNGAVDMRLKKAKGMLDNPGIGEGGAHIG
jgi:DNA replication protein DnaC